MVSIVFLVNVVICVFCVGVFFGVFSRRLVTPESYTSIGRWFYKLHSKINYIAAFGFIMALYMSIWIFEHSYRVNHWLGLLGFE